MTAAAQRFFDSVKARNPSQAELIDLFIYHLTAEMGLPAANAKLIADCFETCDLRVPARLQVQLSEGLRKPIRYIRKDGGYRLEHRRREAIDALIGNDRSATQTSVTLRKLEPLLPAGPKREFFRETIDCFMAGANRATVVMCWNLAVHHLQEYVLAHHLSDFNAVLAKNTDKRVRIKSISKQDDFTEMSESKFLLFCREAKIISSSIFQKLETRLDERNSAAHPSGVKTTPKFAEGYVDDLLENTLLKYVV